MISDFLTRHADVFWPVFGLLLFFCSFVGILLHTSIALRDRDKVSHIAGLPLEPENVVLPDGSGGSEGRTN